MDRGNLIACSIWIGLAGFPATLSDKMAAYKYPRIVEFVEELPKTSSGKILKRVLGERDGLPEERSPIGSPENLEKEEKNEKSRKIE